jgi:hypothetical protein
VASGTYPIEARQRRGNHGALARKRSGLGAARAHEHRGDVQALDFATLSVAPQTMRRLARQETKQLTGGSTVHGVSVKHFLLAIVCAMSGTTAFAAAGEARRVIPAEFRYGRIFVTVRADDGSALDFYTDSGGGWNAISASVAKRLNLPLRGKIQGDGGAEFDTVDFPSFLIAQGVPQPTKDEWLQGRLAVASQSGMDADGFLGGRWFAGHVWEFDYPHHVLAILHRWRAPANAAGRVALGFQTNDSDRRTTNFARVPIVVNGETLQMLLDTGATVQLTASSAPYFHLNAGTRIGGSFITKSTFEQWSHAHPDWKVINDGENITGHATPMIEVPQVTLANQTVGPVWFAERPDKAFREWMTQMMDQPIEGAIGSSAFQYLRMVVDYEKSAAYFFKAEN